MAMSMRLEEVCELLEETMESSRHSEGEVVLTGEKGHCMSVFSPAVDRRFNPLAHVALVRDNLLCLVEVACTKKKWLRNLSPL